MELDRAFAVNGIREDFSNDLSPDGDMSLEQGFTDFFQRKIGGGSNGRQIQLAKFNQLMYLISKGVLDNKANITLNKDAIEALESEFGSLENILTNNTPKLLKQDLEWSVSDEPESETNFNTLSKALIEASKYVPILNKSINITLKTNFILNEAISIKNIDLSFVKISSIDSEVRVNTNISENIFSFSNCNAPIINTLFDYQNNSNNKTFFLYNNSNGVINGGKGVKNSYIGIQTFLSRVNCSGVNLTYAKRHAIQAYICSLINCEVSIFDNFDGLNCIISSCSKISATACKVRNCNASNSVFAVAYGGELTAYEIDKTGTTSTMTNVTPLQLTGSGIIYYA